MFSKRQEDDQSRFGTVSEFHQISEQIKRLENQRDVLRADMDAEAVSAGAAKYHVVANLLKELHAHIAVFDRQLPLDGEDEIHAKIQFCLTMTKIVEMCVESKRAILEMRRKNTEMLEIAAKTAVNVVSVAAWFLSPITIFGGGLAAAAITKYSGDNLVSRYEDSPAKITRTQEMLEELKDRLAAAITIMNISLGKCDYVDPSLFGAAPPSMRNR